MTDPSDYRKRRIEDALCDLDEDEMDALLADADLARKARKEGAA